MSAEQTPDTAAVLAEHFERIHFDGRGCGTNGSGGCAYCFGPSPMSAHEVAQEAAAALAPVLDAAVREAEQRALREAADDFEQQQRALSRMSHSVHVWASACRFLRDRADRITEPASHEAEHDCSRCPDCIHDGNKCCGCYDGACCQDGSDR